MTTKKNDAKELNGIITDIQHFSVHDGPGIRTSVYFKGCNMDCVWCHNPETICFEPEFMLYGERCIGCGKCQEGCFAGAKIECGKRYTVSELVAEIADDKPYYKDSGGVTLTGGEPTCQADFAEAVLKECRVQGIKRAVETNMTRSWSTLVRVLCLCNYIMCDLKAWDKDLHIKCTKIANDRIIENIIKMDSLGIPFTLRTVVVPGVMDSADEIKNIAGFAAGLKNIEAYELLSYHALGSSKIIENKAQRQKFETPSLELMNKLADIARGEGVTVKIDAKKTI